MSMKHAHLWAATSHDDYFLPTWGLEPGGDWQKLTVGKNYACSVCGVPQPPPPPPSFITRLGWRLTRLRMRLASLVAGFDVEDREG